MRYYSQPCHLRVRLFRGDKLGSLKRVRKEGIRGRLPAVAPGLPSMVELSLGGLPPDLLIEFAAPIIERHVTVASDRSPFTSFSTNPHVAARFALAGGRVAVGSHYVLDTVMVRTWWWEGLGGWSVTHADHAGRLWIPTGGLRLPVLHELTAPQNAAQIRAYGMEDQELLLFGRVAPNELRHKVVQRPPFSSQASAF